MEQTKDFMIELLGKIQEEQLKVISRNNGRCLTIAARSLECCIRDGYGIVIDATLLDGLTLLGHWHFHYLDDSGTIQSTLDELTRTVCL